ncbi:MAG: hypothetical protein ACOX88_06380 [Christensenellales bacterium]|jgi:hypothetical protein
MRCGCPSCDMLMVHVDRGLKSHCVCPVCQEVCNQCMGSGKPLEPAKKRVQDIPEEIQPDDAVYRFKK